MHKPLTKFVKFALIAIIAVIGVFILLLYSMPEWLTPTARFALAHYSLQLEQLEFERPGRKQFRFDTVRLQAQNGAWKLNLEGLNIHYSLSSLWRGTLNLVELKSGTLELHSAQAPPEPSLNPETRFAVPDFSTLFLPVSAWIVHQFEVEQDWTSDWVSKVTLNLSGQSQQTHHLIQVKIKNEGEHTADLLLTVLTKPKPMLELKLQLNSVPALTATANAQAPNSKLWSGETLIHLLTLETQLTHWMNSVANKSLIGLDRGELIVQYSWFFPPSGNYSLSELLLALQPNFEFHSQGKAEPPVATVQSVSWSLNASLIFEPTQWQFNMAQDSMLRFILEFPTTDITQALGQSGVLQLYPDKFSLHTNLKKTANIESEGRWRLEYQSMQVPFSAHLTAEPFSLTMTSTPSLQMPLTLSISSPESMQFSNYTLGPWQSHLRANIQSDRHRSHIRLQPDKLFDLQSLQIGALSMARTTVNLERTQFLVHHTGNIASEMELPLSIEFKNLMGAEMHADPFTLSMHLDQWRWQSPQNFELKMRSTIPVLQAYWRDLALPKLQVDGDLDLNPKHNHLQLKSHSLADELKIAMRSEIKNSGNAKFSVNMDWPNWAESGYLKNMIQQQDPEARISHGSLHLDALYQIDNTIPNLALNLNIQNVTAVIDRILVRNLNLQANLPQLFAPNPANTISVSIEQLHPGIPIDALKIDAVAFLDPHYHARIQLHEGQAKLLGGSVWLTPFEWRQDQQEYNFDTHLKNLDLATIIALESQPDLSGSGRLDARLPIRIRPQGIQILNGQAWARSPGGVIRYVPNQLSEEMASTNPMLKLTLQALSNYQYERLSAEVNYRENGDLILNTQLAGRNPDFNQGQFINLNLNVEDNIPTLLKSLRIAQDISGIIDHRMNGK